MLNQGRQLISISRFFILFLITEISFVTTIPSTFITTMNSAYLFEAGSRTLSTSTPIANGSYSSQANTITYLNTYSSTPQFGYGWSFINSNWMTTTSQLQTIIDLSITSSSTVSQVLRLNFTASTILQFGINYIVCATGSQIFLDVRVYYQDLTTTNIYSSSLANARWNLLSLPYKSKSNSSNSVIVYNTVGLSMMRTSNTFEYQLAVQGYSTSTFNLNLTVMGSNGMRFIRLAIFNYQNILVEISSPYFLDMGFGTNLGGTLPDSSGLGLSVTGTIFIGMSDWALSDANAIITYNMTVSGLIYSLSSATVTRTSTGYIWFRQQICLPYYFNLTNTCVACDYSCYSCTDVTNTSCTVCASADFRTLNLNDFSCPCNSNYQDVGVSTCQQIICYNYCTACSSNNYCIGCVTNSYRTLSNGTCVCQSYTIDMSSIGFTNCQACYPTCLTCTTMFSITSCSTCSLTRDHRSFAASNNTCNCVNGYFQIPNFSITYANYIYNGAPCRQCQYTCQTCASSTSCSSCNSTLSRTYNSTTGFCSCSSGFYDNGSVQSCFACPYSCSTCTSTSVCLTCPSTRTFTNNSCPCANGYYDTGAATCFSCIYSCFTCTTNTTCSGCSTSNFRTMSNQTCICNTGYFDTYGSQQCTPCDTTCYTCTSASSSSCTACSSSANRQLTVNSTCVCVTGYFQDFTSTPVCLPCYYTCSQCTNDNSCSNCNASNHRSFLNSSCVCMSSYYDDGGLQLCISCPYYCLTCSGPFGCISCDNTTRNSSNLSSCSCLSGFYDNGVSSSCQSCQVTCASCNNANNCTTCAIGRTITALQSCICQARTYQPYCYNCSYSCLSCVGSSILCTSCNGTAMRYLNTTTSTCVCYTGYYDEPSNEQCGTCQYSCLTCQNSYSCLTCPLNRVINGSNLCSCISSYYQNSVNLNCLPCQYSCQTCSVYSNCSSCDSANHRMTSPNTTLCVCQIGYYDNGANGLCFACSSICLTCSSFSVCTSCNSTSNYYHQNGTCLCVTGYYFDTTSQSCLGCHYSCNSCTGATSCITCQQNRTLVTNSYCTCTTGLYNNPSTLKCDMCTFPCITCSGSSFSCLSCAANRTLNTLNNTCNCIGSTYDTGLACLSCLSTCQTCTNGTACVSCLTNSYRVLNSNNSCLCQTGYHDQNSTLLVCIGCNYTCATCSNAQSCLTCYSGRIAVVGGHCACPDTYYYDNGVNPQCISCSYSCQKCSLVSTNCTSCLASTFRSLSNYTCVCSTGYYDDGSSANCQPCSYSCQSCANPGSSCSACNGSNFRVYQTGPYCSCMTGYFDITNVAMCSNCSYTCLTCVSLTSKCVTCPSTRTFQNITSSCPCNAGFYDSGQATCSSCNYQCSTCITSSTCVTCPSTRLPDSNSNCVCKNSYYDVNGTLNCLSCSPLCLICSSFQTCTLCDTSNNFRQLVNSSCICPSGYFDASSSGNYTCQLCSYSCATCLSLTQCTSCNNLYSRSYSIITKLCICANGYYDDMSHSPCIPCPFDCLTCSTNLICLTCNSNRYLTNLSRCVCSSSYFANGTLCQTCPVECLTCESSSNCTTCQNNRILVNNACICPVSFYSVSGTSTCASCQYSCQTCLTSSQCSSCNDTLLRYLTSTFCLCMIGYYDSPSIPLCQPCQYSCLMCSVANACLTCNAANNRVFNSNTSLCDCVSGYYEDSSTKICIQCPYNCLTCTNGVNCSSCNPTYNRVLNLTTNQCVCPTIGYFDTFTSQVCAVCDITCQSCSSSSTYCTSCLNTTYRALSASSCLCINGYYNIVNQPICLTCSYTCVTCSISATNCNLCSFANFREQNLTSCVCLSGYYDAGVSVCALCNYVCQTCSNSITCSSCNLTISRRQLNSNTSLCSCISSYYDSGSAICSACLYSCQTCAHPTECLTCPSTRSLSVAACACLAGYYDDGMSLQCQPCNYSCHTCLNSSTCFSCSSTSMRTYNSSTLLCSCLIGYYDTGVKSCSKCDASCYTCITSNSCSSCPPNINKVINSTIGNLCICLYGYFENITAGVTLGYNSVCDICYYACQTCSSISTYCLICGSSSNRVLTSSHQCKCLSGFFDNGQQTCISCYTNCLTCTGTLSNNCLSCDNNTFYLNNICYTTCPTYYNSTTSPSRICQSCPTNCLSCPSSFSVCTQCKSTYFIFSYNSSYSICIQNCPNYYYQINSTCYQCISPCVTCSAAYTCLSCLSLYYFNNGSCYPCNSFCLTCAGSTALDCLTCIPNYILMGSICQKLYCSATQFVHSTLGCVSCSTYFPNSLSCISTGASSCQDGYILQNNSCYSCSQVTGYVLDTSTGKCKDRCGDGIIITDKCDDGNTLNGDGCSSMCTIEYGWLCPNNSCQITITPVVTLVSMTNSPISNSLTIVITISPGLRLITGNFIINFTYVTAFAYTVVPLNVYYTSYQIVIYYYQTIQNNYLTLNIKSPISSSRLLVSSSLQLTISLALSLSFQVNTAPPAVYNPQGSTQTYSKYLFGLFAFLHLLILAMIAITLLMKLKVMLLIIDSLNSLTILYILVSLGFYNITLLSYEATRSLQPFIYQFGSPLQDQNTNFYYFNYTSDYFSSSIIQVIIIATCILVSFLYDKFSSEGQKQNNWHYYRKSFVFAFSYDLLLTSFSTFFWNPYTSYQSSYSWMFSILTVIYILFQSISYYRRMVTKTNGKKILPAVSFITNDLENKEKPKIDSIMDFQDEESKDKKIIKNNLGSEQSDEKTEVVNDQVDIDDSKIFRYYDLQPSFETQYSMKHSNHINSSQLPILCIFFGLLYSIAVNIQSLKIRSVFLCIISFLYFIFVIVSANQTLKSIRNIKLVVFSIIYIIISITGTIACFNYQTVNLQSIDVVIVSLVCAGLVSNIVTFILNVCKSEAYREYLINKKNEQIIERTRKQNEVRQKIYNKNNKDSKNNTKTIFNIDNTELKQPQSLEVYQPQIQISEEQVQEKHLKISALKNRKNMDSRTFVYNKQSSSILNLKIDDEISDMKDGDYSKYKGPILDEKNIFDDRKSHVNSPGRQGNRIRAINNSTLTISQKGQTPSLFFDNTLEKIEQHIGRRNINKSKEKEEVSPKKMKMKRKKRIAHQIDIVDSQEQKIERIPADKTNISRMMKEEQDNRNYDDMLSDLDMPKGFKLEQTHKESQSNNFRARMLSIDEISSIKEERQQFNELQEKQDISVFNKILNDYKKYNHKKIDRKKLKELKSKMADDKQK